MANSNEAKLKKKLRQPSQIPLLTAIRFLRKERAKQLRQATQ